MALECRLSLVRLIAPLATILAGGFDRAYKLLCCRQTCATEVLLDESWTLGVPAWYPGVLSVSFPRYEIGPV